MKLSLIVHPASKRNLITREQDLFGQEIYHLYTVAKPIDGEANRAVLQQMADFLGIKKYQIKLISGEKNKHKKLEIIDFEL